jgi:hypothetical protein
MLGMYVCNWGLEEGLLERFLLLNLLKLLWLKQLLFMNPT